MHFSANMERLSAATINESEDFRVHMIRIQEHTMLLFRLLYMITKYTLLNYIHSLQQIDVEFYGSAIANRWQMLLL